MSNSLLQFQAGALAERFGLELRGDPATPVDGVATLANAGPAQLAFLANPRYRAQLGESRAGVIVLRGEDADAAPGTVLLARDPYSAFAKIAALFEARPAFAAGIHPSAIVDASASVDPGASIGPLVCVGARSRIAAGVRIGPGCVIGEDCEIGPGSELVGRATLVRRVRLGSRVLVHPGAVLGADGFGLAMERPADAEPHWIKVPQLGGVQIGDDCEIGANTTIDRGALDDTVLEHDVRLDNQIQVGHNTRIGAHTAIAGCVAIAGSVRIGRYCMIAGMVGIAGHLEICDRVVVTAFSMVTHTIREPGEYSSGISAAPSREWRRTLARLRQLDTMARTLSALDKGKGTE